MVYFFKVKNFIFSFVLIHSIHLLKSLYTSALTGYSFERKQIRETEIYNNKDSNWNLQFGVVRIPWGGGGGSSYFVAPVGLF